MFDTDFQNKIALCHARVVFEYATKIGLVNF
jgi:hypothetical protein